MSIINGVSETLHKIRVRLYHNYLPQIPGKYIARTDDEASLSIEQVCAAAKNRGGYTGSYEDLVEHVKIYLDEAAYQLADGFSVNTGLFSVHPKISGTFEKAGDLDQKVHRVNFSFRTLAPLRRLASKIEILVEGIADVSGYIDEVLDVSTGSADDALTPGGIFTVSGGKIRIEGDREEVGIYFVPEAGGDAVKLTGNLAENTASKIIAAVPALYPGVYRLRLVTQYTPGSILKEPRTIGYGADLTVG